MRRALAALWLAVWWTTAARADGGDLLHGDTSFEVGGAGFHLRTGLASGASRWAAIVGGGAPEGEHSVRLCFAAGNLRPALEMPWVRLDPGWSHALSAWVRGDRPGRRVSFRIISAGGPDQTVTFAVGPDWRRYSAPFNTSAAGGGWCCFAVEPAADEGGREPLTVWIDGLRLERGEATAYRPRPALGVLLSAASHLRHAGERVDFRILLRTPGASEPVRVSWRLEDPFGVQLRAGHEACPVGDDGYGELRVRENSLRPGAYRLVATAEVAGESLVDQTTVVAVVPKLGDPEAWFGVTGADGHSGQVALDLLRIGLDRGVVGPAPDWRLRGGLQRLLDRYWHSGVEATGYLPQAQGTPAEYQRLVAEVVHRADGLVRWWEPAPGDQYASATWLRAAYDGVRQGDRKSTLIGLRLSTDGSQPPLDALSDAIGAGWLDCTDAVALELGDGPPELAGASGLARLLSGLPLLLTEAGRRLPVIVSAGGWPAEPWATQDSLPAQAAQRVTPLLQASFLVRAMLLARAGGAARFFYGGAPLADRAAALTVPAAGTTGDLFDYTGAPLPAVAALDNVLDSLRGRELERTVALGPGITCQLWRRRRPLAVIWQWQRPGARCTWTIPLAASAVYAQDLFGRALPVRGSNSEARIEVGEHPLFVEWRHEGSLAFAKALRQSRLNDWPRFEVAPAPVGSQLGVAVCNGVEEPLSGQVSLRTPAGEVGRADFGPLPAEQVASRPLTALTSLPPNEETPVTVAGQVGDEQRSTAGSVLWRPCPPAGAERLWSELKRLSFGNEGVGPRPRLAVAWDRDGLTITVETGAPAPGDTVEVLLDPAPLRHTFVPGADGDEVRVVLRAADGQPLAGAGRLRAPAQVAQTPDGRWQLQFRLDWSRLSRRPAAGQVWGFDLAVTETDTTGVKLREHRWRGALPTRREPRCLGWLLFQD